MHYLQSVQQKITFLCFVFLLIFIYSFQYISGIKEASHVKELMSKHLKNTIKIDGVLNEKDWICAPSIIITDDTRRSDNKVKVMTLWDEQNLYFAFDVEDKNLQAKQKIQDHGLLAKDDVVEFLIDTKNKKDSCWGINDLIYHINLLGQKKDDIGTVDCKTDSKWNGTAKYAVKVFGTLNDSTDTDKGYKVEVAISWVELAIKPLPGLKISADFGNGDSGIFFDWVGAHPFRSPYAFGDLKLIRE